MRHGVAFRKLSRTSSHRDLMLRNMVSSLLEHEQIKTTLAKAKEASRVAEWIITLGKDGRLADKQRAQAFLMNPQRTVPKLFTELAARYAHRTGGYTRVHRFGHRQGDHAPHAILELVDNPNDLKFALTAKAVGRELAKLALAGNNSIAIWAGKPGQGETSTVSTSESQDPSLSTSRIQLPPIFNHLQPRTRKNVIMAVKFRNASSIPSGQDPLTELQRIARQAFFHTSAVSKLPSWELDNERIQDLRANAEKFREGTLSTPVTVPGYGRKIWAGQEDISKTIAYAKSANGAEDKDEWTDMDAQKLKADEAELQDMKNSRLERLLLLKSKTRHPEGRNGINSQRSALRRVQGDAMSPRTLGERWSSRVYA